MAPRPQAPVRHQGRCCRPERPAIRARLRRHTPPESERRGLKRLVPGIRAFTCTRHCFKCNPIPPSPATAPKCVARISTASTPGRTVGFRRRTKMGRKR